MSDISAAAVAATRNSSMKFMNQQRQVQRGRLEVWRIGKIEAREEIEGGSCPSGDLLAVPSLLDDGCDILAKSDTKNEGWGYVTKCGALAFAQHILAIARPPCF
jgi:hypothetical protein